jgi:hypothetical protein
LVTARGDLLLLIELDDAVPQGSLGVELGDRTLRVIELNDEAVVLTIVIDGSPFLGEFDDLVGDITLLNENGRSAKLSGPSDYSHELLRYGVSNLAESNTDVSLSIEAGIKYDTIS